MIRAGSKLGALLLFAVLYYLGALLGLFLSFESAPFASLWPPSVILILGLALTSGSQRIYVVVVGLATNFLFNYFQGHTLVINGFFCLTNLLEGLLALGFIEIFLGGRDCLLRFDRIVYPLMAYVFLISPAAATLGGLSVTHFYRQHDFLYNWRIWWFADAIGTTIFLPLASAALDRWSKIKEQKPPPQNILTALLAIISAASLAYLVFIDEGRVMPSLFKLPAISFLLVTVVALKCSPLTVHLTTAVIALIATYATTRGLGILSSLIDGYTVVRHLRELGNQTPIVAVTAHAMAHDRDLCLKSGCTDYMAKPFTFAQLQTCLASHLRPLSSVPTQPRLYENGCSV